MKKSRIIIAVLVLVALIAGICVTVTMCSKGSFGNGGTSSETGKAGEQGTSIVGKWNADNPVGKNVTSAVIEYYSNGTFLYTSIAKGVESKESGTYEIKGDKYTEWYDDDDEDEGYTGTFKISGDKLTITMHGKDEIFTKVK